jgi:hypothetical protein
VNVMTEIRLHRLAFVAIGGHPVAEHIEALPAEHLLLKLHETER